MVRLSFATLALIVALVSARPHHHHYRIHRRTVCQVPTSSQTPTSLSPSLSPTQPADPVYDPAVKANGSGPESISSDSISVPASATLSTTSSKPSQTPPPGDGAPSGGSSRMKALVPVSGARLLVSYTAAEEGGNKDLDSLPSQKRAKTDRSTIGFFHQRQAIRAEMKQGSYKPGTGIPGGMSFYSPQDALLEGDHYIFGYSVYFEEGFDWNKGGKLPGFYGGSSPEAAVKCSGGNREDDDCFSTRLMWRREGDGELYAYLPLPGTPSYNHNDKLCFAPEDDCETNYGYSLGRGTWRFKSGQWITVSQRIKLNTPGQANGEAEIWVTMDGKTERVINLDGMVYRGEGASKARGLQMQTFFGGSTGDWASPKDQDIYFADFTTALLD